MDIKISDKERIEGQLRMLEVAGRRIESLEGLVQSLENDYQSAMRPVRGIATAPQSEWVSVKDRLPPEDGFVIARSIGGVSLDSRYSTGTSVLYFSHLMEKGFEFQSQHRASHVTVTHWMPLPEPPK